MAHTLVSNEEEEEEKEEEEEGEEKDIPALVQSEVRALLEAIGIFQCVETSTHWVIRIPRTFSTAVHVEDPESNGVFLRFQLEPLLQKEWEHLSQSLGVKSEDLHFGNTEASIFVHSPR